MGGGLWSLARDFVARLVASTLILTLLAASPGVAAPLTTDRSNYKTEDLPTPVCVAPSGITFETSPEFAWRPVDGATSYEFAVADSAGKRVFRRDGIAATTFRIPGNDRLDPGDYSFTIRAYDHKNHRASAYSTPMTFTVIDARQAPPTVSFVAAQGVVLDGSSTLLTWNVDNANSVVVDNSIGAVTATGTVAVYPAFDTTWTLVASGPGGTTTATAGVHVNHAPTVALDANATLGPAPLGVEFSAQAFDPDGDVLAYAWDLDGDGAIDSTSTSAAYSYGSRGTYPASVTVTDVYGASASSATTVSVTTPLPVLSAEAAPVHILKGESSLLNWTSVNVDSVTLEGHVQPLAPAGMLQVSPSTDTTYTFRASNESGETLVEVPVSVNTPPVADLSASQNGTVTAPAAVVFDASASLDPDGRISEWRWTVDGEPVSETGLTLDQTLAAGHHTVAVTVIDDEGATDSAQVELDAYDPPSATFSAADSLLIEGGTTLLSWCVDHADTVVIDNGIGPVARGGVLAVTPAFDTTWTLTATGPGGTLTREVPVKVDHIPSVRLSATPDRGPAPLDVTLRAEATDLDGDDLTYTWEVADRTSGSVGESLLATRFADRGTYPVRITVTDPYGASASDMLTVTVTSPLPSVQASATPDHILVGQQTVLSWTSAETDRVSLAGTDAVLPVSGEMTVTPAEDTTYALTVVNESGSTTALVPVSVNIPPTASIAISPAETMAAPAQLTADGATSDDPDGSIVKWEWRVDGQLVDETGSVLRSTLQAGEHRIALTVTDNEGATASAEAFVNVLPPPPSLTATSANGYVMRGESTVISWSTIGADRVEIDKGIGPVPTSGTYWVAPVIDTTYTVTAYNATGSTSKQVFIHVSPAVRQPVGSFGEDYQDIIPSNSAISVYAPDRFSVIRGRVLDRDGDPVEGAVASVHGEWTYGTALSKADGTWALPVLQATGLTIDISKSGYLPSSRKVTAEAHEICMIDDVVLVKADTKATTITFNGGADTTLVHTSTPVSDIRGTRGCTIITSGDNQAWGVGADGKEVALSSLTLRATEFEKPDEMPAALPSQSAFTYCTELSADGWKTVRFKKPVTVFVDNFIGFPVGTSVPSGYYDRDKGAWVPSDDGFVVKLLDTTGDGIVDALDGDGDGDGDDLDADGSYIDEVEGLADPSVYEPGSTHWRMSLDHFTPWDFNFALWVPVFKNPEPKAKSDGASPCDCPENTNSYVTRPSRVLHEDVPVAGTGMTLHYASDRLPDRPTVIDVPLDPEIKTAGLVHVQVRVAGRSLDTTLVGFGAPDHVSFNWDGKDWRGRAVEGAVKADVAVNALIPGFYSFTPMFVVAAPNVTWVRTRAFGRPAFANPGAVGFISARLDQWMAPPSGIRSPSPSSFLQVAETGLGISPTSITGGSVPSTDMAGLATSAAVWVWHPSRSSLTVERPLTASSDIARGWSLSAHHAALPDKQGSVLKGDGSMTVQTPSMYSLFNHDGFYSIEGVQDMTVDSLGRIIVWSQNMAKHRTQRVELNGKITRLEGKGPVEAGLDGSYYQVAGSRIHRYDKYDAGRVAAGDGGQSVSPSENVPATSVPLAPSDIAADRFGNVYIAEPAGNRVRLVTSDGLISTFIGLGSVNPTEGVAAADVRVPGGPEKIACAPDGSLYFTWSTRIFQVDTQGVVHHVAGNGAASSGSSDYSGKAATETALSINNMSVDENGFLHIAVNRGYDVGQVYRVESDGKLSLVVGSTTGQFQSGSLPALRARTWATCVANGPHGIVYTGNGNPWSFSYTGIGIVKNAYAASAYDKDIYAADGSEVHRFDPNGRHVQTLDAASKKKLLDFSYDPAGKLSGVTDRFGRSVRIERDPDGKPTRVIAPDGQVTSLAVSAGGDLTDVRYEDGSRWDLRYDAAGNMFFNSKPGGSTGWYRFDDNGRVTDFTDANGHTTTFSRESADAVTSSVTNALGERQTTVRSDGSQGRTFTSISAAGAESKSTIGPDALSSSSLSPVGIRTDTTSELDSNLVQRYTTSAKTMMPSGLALSTTTKRIWNDYNNDGTREDLTVDMTVNGRASSVNANYLSGTTTSRSATGRTSSSAFDVDTLLTKRAQTPGLLPVDYSYDGQGRPTRTQVGDRLVETSYDASGNVASVTSPAGTVSMTYDLLGRVLTATRPDGSVVRYGYDAGGHTISLVVPTGAEHSFTFDLTGDSTGWGIPGGRQYSYEYDAAHRPTKVIAPSGKAIESHYSKGLLTTVTAGDETIAYTRHPSGSLDAVSRGSEVESMTYDGSLLTKDSRSGAATATLTFAYNNDFAPTSFGYAGATQAYGYDADGLMTSAAPFSITRRADNGLPTSVTASGFSLARGFTGYGEMDSTTLTVGAASRYAYSLTRDTAGRITSRTETIGGETITWTYAYDLLGRLIEVHRNGELAEAYAYDADGNRTETRVPSRGIDATVAATFGADDAIVTAGDASYVTDADGFVTSRTDVSGTATFAYSALGELTSASLPDGRELAYDYDAAGRRLTKRLGGEVTERYLWADTTKLLATYDASGTFTARFTYADGRMPYLMTKAGATYYLAYDQVGSLRLVTDASGSTVKRLDYDSFGNVVSDSNPGFTVPFSFAGGLVDTDTGLVHFGAREYEPSTGRWMSKDPIGFRGGDANLYAYCGANPVLLIDPTGLSSLYGPGAVVTLTLLTEIAMQDAMSTASDLSDVGSALSDPTASGMEKCAAVVGCAVGAVIPGPGQAKGAREGARAISNLPTQLHHFATDKNSVFTPTLENIARRFGLSLDGSWNKAPMPHRGRHPNEYHGFVLRNMERAAAEAGDDPDRFISLFNSYVADPVLANPEMLRKDYWR